MAVKPKVRAVHLYPSRDSLIHECKGSECPCGTVREFIGKHWLVFHTPFDGRERKDDEWERKAE